MAAIDKIYVNTVEQFKEFKDWCKAQPPIEDKYGKKVHITSYLYDWEDEDLKDKKGDFPVFNAPYYIDAYVIRNCPLDYIQRHLMLNYGHKTEEDIKEMYEIVKNRTEEEQEKCKKAQENDCFPVAPIFYWWLKLDDFIVDGEKIDLKNKEKSSYEEILDGELYATPYREGVEYGTHCKMIDCPRKHGYNNPETPLKIRNWDVEIEMPNKYDFMWFHHGKDWSKGTWDFSDEFVACDWSSSTAYVSTIRALKRKIRKWRLPVGAKVIARGRYLCDKYEFLVTK